VNPAYPPRTDIVVLAAGRGSRLGALGEDTPKWLLEVGDRTIADCHLESVELARRDSPSTIRSVQAVTGHAAEGIDKYLRQRLGLVGTIFNPDYARLNNWYSVLLALDSLEPDPERRLVIINSDLYARPAWFADFIAEATRTPHESLIGIDLERELTDESMKVSVEEGPPMTVTGIGKVGIDNAAGEYVGLLMARGSVLEDFREALRGFVDRPEHDDEWYERAVGLTAAAGTPWVVHPMPDGDWVEIDDDGDYAAALELTETV
jgi:choline kinase